MEALLRCSRMYGVRLVCVAPESEAMLERLAATLIEANVIVEADKARFVHAISALTVDCSGAPWGQFRQDVSEATKMVRDLP